MIINLSFFFWFFFLFFFLWLDVWVPFIVATTPAAAGCFHASAIDIVDFVLTSLKLTANLFALSSHATQ